MDRPQSLQAGRAEVTGGCPGRLRDQHLALAGGGCDPSGDVDRRPPPVAGSRDRRTRVDADVNRRQPAQVAVQADAEANHF